MFGMGFIEFVIMLIMPLVFFGGFVFVVYHTVRRAIRDEREKSSNDT